MVCQAVVPDAPTNVGGLMPGGDRSVGRGKGGLKALNTLSLPFRIIPTCEHVENIVYRFGYRPIPTSCTDRIYRSANLSCGGVAVVRGALGCCHGWRVLLSSLRGRRCGHLATGRGTVARPRLVCPHKRSDPVDFTSVVAMAPRVRQARKRVRPHATAREIRDTLQRSGLWGRDGTRPSSSDWDHIPSVGGCRNKNMINRAI